MAFRSHSFFLLCLSCLVACGVDVPSANSEREPVTVVPLTDSGLAPQAWRASGQFEAAPLPRLFEGHLSDYHLGRSVDAELPSTLEVRRVPLWVRRGERASDAVPLVLLHGDETYSLVTGPGEVTEIAIDSETELWRRVWPNGAAVRFAWFCRTESEWPSRWSSITALSDGTAARWELGENGKCALLGLEGAPGPLGAVSPSAFLGRAVEPTLFGFGATQAGCEVDCGDDEQTLGPGCVAVLDDRIALRSGACSALWRLDGDVSADVITQPDRQQVVVGFEPGTTSHLSLQVYVSSGAAWRGEALLSMAAAQPHLVINEVLANPVGPEPQQEWIEIVNTGSEPVDVGDFELHDGAGAVALPPALLRPGQYALIVREDYDEGLGWDVVPDVDVLLLRVSSLGKSGLSNSGEPLWLQDAQGAVASRFPPLSASRQGESWARRSLEAPDDTTTSFAVHAPPGASPGAPNALSE